MFYPKLARVRGKPRAVSRAPCSRVSSAMSFAFNVHSLHASLFRKCKVRSDWFNERKKNTRSGEVCQTGRGERSEPPENQAACCSGVTFLNLSHKNIHDQSQGLIFFTRCLFWACLLSLTHWFSGHTHSHHLSKQTTANLSYLSQLVTLT